MRILRVTPWIYPDTKGGGDYHVHAMSRDQAAMGHEVTVLTTREDQSLPRIEKTHGYTIVRVSPGVTLFNNDVSPAVARYLWRVDSDDFDVIHAHSHLYFTSNLAALKSRLSGIPMVITNHGLFSQSAPRKLQEKYLYTAGRWTINQADRVFCYTEGEKKRLRTYGVRSEVSIVSNGIDPKLFQSDGPLSELIDADGPVVLSVIRLVDGKRPFDAVKGIKNVRSDFPDIHLILLGDGYLRDQLQTYVQDHNLESNVTLLDPVAYDHMPKLYRSADILLHPSEEEAGTPRVVLEAMATEKPFIMADLEQTTDELDPAGVTYPVGNIEDIGDSIQRLLSDREKCARLGNHGRSLVKKEFNWETTVNKSTNILKEVAHGTTTAPD